MPSRQCRCRRRCCCCCGLRGDAFKIYTMPQSQNARHTLEHGVARVRVERLRLFMYTCERCERVRVTVCVCGCRSMSPRYRVHEDAAADAVHMHHTKLGRLKTYIHTPNGRIVRGKQAKSIHYICCVFVACCGPRLGGCCATAPEPPMSRARRMEAMTQRAAVWPIPNVTVDSQPHRHIATPRTDIKTMRAHT